MLLRKACLGVVIARKINASILKGETDVSIRVNSVVITYTYYMQEECVESSSVYRYHLADLMIESK